MSLSVHRISKDKFHFLFRQINPFQQHKKNAPTTATLIQKAGKNVIWENKPFEPKHFCFNSTFSEMFMDNSVAVSIHTSLNRRKNPLMFYRVLLLSVARTNSFHLFIIKLAQ